MTISARNPYELAVIGAGASGTLCAAQWARRAPAGARLALVEAGARAARGLAYGTPYGAHLLNVPAGRMSAFPDDPGHFLAWLQAREAEAGPATFAPRPLYGDYLAGLLEAPDPAGALERINASAVGLTREEGGWRIHLRDGRQLAARQVVLALGNLPPGDPLRLGDDAPVGYLRDPWAPGAAQGLAPDAPVLLIGAGLTAVDLILALREQGHAGPLYALSRHGRLPAAHRPHDAVTLDPPAAARAAPVAMTRWLRAQLRATAAAGGDWRAVVDALRPHTQAIWRGWDAPRRAQFLRHARWLWEAHRHRMAPEIAARIQALLDGGALRLLRGRVQSLAAAGGGMRVVWRDRDGRAESLEVARVLNCTGPASDYARVDLPLVASLRAAGWLTPDPLGMGVRTAEDGRLLDRDGAPVDGLWTLGPLRKGDLWESTAIPEIRDQAARLIERLAAAE